MKDAALSDARTDGPVTPMDGGPRDLSMANDFAQSQPADLAVTIRDFAVLPGADLTMGPPDLAMARLDLSMGTPDLSTPPDIAMTPPDFSGVPGCGAGPPCGAGLTCCSGTCVDVQTNVNNCGSCGNFCDIDYGVGKCVAGACAIASCNKGFDNCDGRISNGCEAYILANDQNCGRCGKVCPSGGTGCWNGFCQ